MKTAVVYYSLEGNVKYVAEKVSGALGAEIIPLIPVKSYPDKGFRKFIWGGKAATMKEKPELEPYHFNVDNYELIILCSPVWAGTFAPPLRTFLAENDLSGKKIAVVASSSGGNADKCIDRLMKCAGAEDLIAKVSLIDPKTKPTQENEEKISIFIDNIKSK